MKKRVIGTLIILFVLCGSSILRAQEETTIITPSTEAGESLDLKAVSELFKESENLEEFEKSLNDPDIGINNLDLDENGEVDFIRVSEEVADDTHMIILQVPISEDEFQDIATIEVEETGDDEYNMQVRGNEIIYGINYYIYPSYTRISTWPIISWIYRPYYRPYRSIYTYGFYPRWWRPYRPVHINIYRSRAVRLTNRTVFRATRSNRITSIHKINYKSRTSPRVLKSSKVNIRKTTRINRNIKSTPRRTTKVTTVKKNTTAKKVTTVKKKKKK